MEKFIEKLIARLEEYKYSHLVEREREMLEHCAGNESGKNCDGIDCFWCVWDKSIEIVNQLAEEYKHCALCYLQSPCEYQNENAMLPNELLADENGWIPCSERLPEEKGKYLVTVKNLTGFWIMENNVFVCDYAFDTFIFQGWEDNDVIAWQPLPEPYKGE